MGKGKKKKPISPKKSIQSLQESRDGGQIALRGYTYHVQHLCGCEAVRRVVCFVVIGNFLK